MILPKKLTEKEIWKSSNDIDKERYLDSSAQKELADYFERIIYDENLTATKRTKMLQEGLRFLRDEK